jgi:integrase
MRKHSPENERIKHNYFAFLKEAKRYSEPTIDAAAKALHRFEEYTKYRDFKAFHIRQAIAFKKHLATERGERSGEKLSKATIYASVTQLKRFFQWLASQSGYKSRLRYSDAEYFNLCEKDMRIATAQRVQRGPTVEQINYVIQTMPSRTEIERRNRALVAFILLTGARDGAVASMRLKHVDLIEKCVHQDAREVNTKFSKTFNTYFFPVGEETLRIVSAWIIFLKEEKLWGDDDPLFPATRIALGDDRLFAASGLDRKRWSSASPIRMKRMLPSHRWHASPGGSVSCAGIRVQPREKSANAACSMAMQESAAP